MIQISPHMRILLAVVPIDFRVGIDGLVALCRQRLEADPFSGGVFVFSNRRRSSIKILMYDGSGYWLCQKRLSSGHLAYWPDGTGPASTLEACELQVLLMGGDPTQANVPAPWRRLPVAASRAPTPQRTPAVASRTSAEPHAPAAGA